MQDNVIKNKQGLCPMSRNDPYMEEHRATIQGEKYAG